MTEAQPTTDHRGADGGVSVVARFWAAARAAAEVDAEPVDGVTTLADLLAELHRRHPSRKFADVIGCCSILVGDRPVAARPAAEVLLLDGQSIEFLPPFAGG